MGSPYARGPGLAGPGVRAVGGAGLFFMGCVRRGRLGSEKTGGLLPSGWWIEIGPGRLSPLQQGHGGLTHLFQHGLGFLGAAGDRVDVQLDLGLGTRGANA